MLDILRNTTTLDPADIRINGGTQSRVRIDLQTVSDYADAMREGAEFPPVTVYYDGATYWLADGFHRVQAWIDAYEGQPIHADVRQGDRREAVLHSVGANDAHGLRRTNEDKQRAVLHLLEDGEWGKWGNMEIARLCKVSEGLVRRMKKDAHFVQNEVTYRDKHGNVSTMQTASIGASKPQPASPSIAVIAANRIGCRGCGRVLTDPDSISNGIGPCCAQKERAASNGDQSGEDIENAWADPPIVYPTRPERLIIDPITADWQRLQAWHGALTTMILELGNHGDVAEDFYLGNELQALRRDAEALRVEVKRLTPADRL